MLKQIPKIMNYYWEGDKFSYLHFLSIKSFVDLNPDWTTRIHTPTTMSSAEPDWSGDEQKTQYTGANYFHKLQELDVEIISFDINSYLGRNVDSVHVVKRSDLFRWKLLSKEGGGWSDADILYVKPLSALLTPTQGTALGNVKTTNLNDITEVVPFYTLNIVAGPSEKVPANYEIPPNYNPILTTKLIQPIGFFLASPEGTYFDIINEVAQKFDEGEFQNDYQAAGLHTLEKAYPCFPDMRSQHPGMVNVGQIPFYAYTWDKVGWLYKEINELYKHPDVVGVHWFSGDGLSAKFKNYLTEDTLEEEATCTIHKIVQSIG